MKLVRIFIDQVYLPASPDVLPFVADFWALLPSGLCASRFSSLLLLLLSCCMLF